MNILAYDEGMETKKAIGIIGLCAVVGVLIYVALGQKQVPAVVPEPSPADFSVTSQPVKITEEKEFYTIDVTYPETSFGTVTADLKTFATDTITQWKQQTNIENLTPEEIEMFGLGDGRTHGLWISYQETVSAHAVSYLVAVSTYEGGAHPNTGYISFVYDQLGKKIELADLFKSGIPYLKRLSEFARVELATREFAAADMIAAGTEPTTENFSTFAIEDIGLTLVFSPYQVAPYAAGEQLVTIPWDQLSDLLNQ